MCYGGLYLGAKLLGHIVDPLRLCIKMLPVNTPKTTNKEQKLTQVKRILLKGTLIIQNSKKRKKERKLSKPDIRIHKAQHLGLNNSTYFNRSRSILNFRIPKDGHKSKLNCQGYTFQKNFY